MLQLCVCRDIERLGSLESTQEARVALGCASCNSYASFVLSKLPACSISRHTHAEGWFSPAHKHNISITSENTCDISVSISRNIKRTNPLICLMLFSLAHKHKHKKNKHVRFSCVYAYACALILVLMRK